MVVKWVVVVDVTKKQMKKIIYTLVAIGLAINLQAQESYQMKGNNNYAEIDILSSYYSQDGNNGAVTGGIGTEQLTDLSSIVVINIPLDSTKSINGSFGADYYTSASTDNIDSNRSSASSKDVRTYGNLGYSQKWLNSGLTLGGRGGFSVEYDYTSINGGLNLAKEFNQGNSEISISTQAFFDDWGLYFPRELRGQVNVPTTKRKAYNASLSYAQVINKKMQIAITAEAIYMKGLLSTPFHRVYFSDAVLPDIERLPSSRLKIPVSVRATFYPTEKLVLRSYYRFYSDDFGIQGHTFSLEAPIKVSDVFTVSPFYRFHTQNESDYFAPFAIHNSGDDFYSSDYDLSALSSNKIGLGISYSPLYGVSRAKIPLSKKLFLFNSIGLRGSYYKRSTGLKAYSIAIEMNFRI